MNNETILCLRNNDIERFLKKTNDGVIFGNENDLRKVLSECGLWFGPRPALENDETYRQIIPYVILKYNGSTAVYSRSPNGGESRLHNKLSIGFGGHIALPDVSSKNGIVNALKTIRNATIREIDEEVICSRAKDRIFLGWLYNDDSPVNRVHLGIIELWELEDDHIKSNEEEICSVRFISKEELKDNLNSFESWSRLVANAIIECEM